VSYFTLRIIDILMDTITDLYISAHSDCRSPPDPGRGGGDLALGYRWGERDPGFWSY